MLNKFAHMLEISNILDDKGFYKLSDRLTSVCVRIAQETKDPWYYNLDNPFTGWGQRLYPNQPGGVIQSKDLSQSEEDILNNTPIDLPATSQNEAIRNLQMEHFNKLTQPTYGITSNITNKRTQLQQAQMEQIMKNEAQKVQMQWSQLDPAIKKAYQEFLAQ